MKLLQLKKHFTEGLTNLYPSEEILSFFNILAEDILGYDRVQTALNRDIVISTKQLDQFEQSMERLRDYEPIQYILGHVEFYGLQFKVDRRVLIPRPETEELVRWIVEDARPDTTLDVLDIGTGSGCIVISLAKNLDEAVLGAMDVSSEVIKVAKDNAQFHNVDVDFFQIDLFDLESLPKNYDVIVSNPPYVRELEKESMRPNVLNYEPTQALFVSNEDPLLYYGQIAQLSYGSLKQGGKLYFEINEYLSEELTSLLKDLGFVSIEIRKDFRGKPRMIKCIK